jgi:outer membrane protein assembly factor BamB
MRRNPDPRVNLWMAVCATTASASMCLVTRVPAEDAVGWRFNGAGEFKAVVPPTRWSDKEGIAWKSRLPATSISSPVAAGHCAFVMAEPNRLLCVRLSDGRVLWECAQDYEAVFDPDRVKEIKQQHAESQRVREEIAGLEKQLKSAQDAKNSDRVASLQNQIRTLQQRDEKLTTIPRPQADATGNTASTPVCDLENVYALLGNGIVSSHRLDGKRNWIRFIGKPMSRHSASPLIAGNLLVLQLQQLVALDRRSGEIVWKSDTPPRNGTPIMLSVGNLPVLVTPAGAVVGAEDGKVLAKGLFDLAYCSPIARKNMVYAAERGRLLAIRLSPGHDQKMLQTDLVWQTRGSQEDRLASPVIHEGLLFSATGTGILDVVDIKSGKLLKRKRMELGAGRVDASLSLANGRLYIHSTNGTTAVLEPTADVREVARNKAEGSSSSSPFFVDDRILFRTPTHLICIGGTHEQAGLNRR